MRYLYGIIIALIALAAFVAIWTRAFGPAGSMLIVPIGIAIIWSIVAFFARRGRLDKPYGVRRVYRSQTVKKSLSETSPKILYFQPDEAAAKRFAVKLIQAGFDVIHFQSPGADPVQLVKKEKPALIMADVMMPGLDGLELTRQIKKQSEIKNLPIIGVSDIGSEAVRQKALAAGMKDFLSLRHLTIDEIVVRITQYLP